MPEINEIVSKQAVNSIVEADKAISQLDDNTIKFNKTIDSLINSLNKGKITFDQVQSAQKKTENNTKQLTAEQKKLEQIEKQIAVNTDKVVRAKIEQSKATKEQKDRINELVQAESGELGTLQKLANENKKLTKERKTLNLETEKGRKRLKEINAQLDTNNSKIKSNSDALTKQKINIGNYSSALGGLSGTLGRAVTAVQTFGRSLLALLANPIVAIVAAIVAAFAALVAVFKSTDDGGTKLEALFNSLSSVLDVLKRRASLLIESLTALFSGDFTEAANKFGEAVSGIGEELANTTKAAWEYTMAQDAINDRQIAFISDIAKFRNEIEKNIALSKDQTKTDQERIAALERAIELEEGLAQKKVELANAELQNELKLAAAKANISEKLLEIFITADEDRQTSLRANNKIIADAWNILGDETIKTLEELYAKAINADTEFFRRSQRSVSQLSGLRKRLSKETNEEVIKTERERLPEITKLEMQITDVVSNELATRADLQIAEANRGADGEIEARKRSFEDQKRIAGEIVGAAATTANMLLDIEAQRFENETIALENQKQYELQLAGDNEAEKERVNEKFAKKESALKTRRAKADKRAAIIQANISIAQGILSALSLTPPISFILAALTAALGAVQLATISAQPIPQFYKGTESAPGGLISVGEKGRELIQTKTGQLLMANNPTITSGLEGAKIFTNKETESIMNHSGYDSPDVMKDVIRSNNRIAKAIENQPILNFETSKRRITERRGNYKKTYINRKVTGIE